ncbi:sperm-egg fusion protein TMEM95-like isoform X3 [Chiloscyllium plagiosum]|uniref:sperm-egg fusion protein TMEM95-like isoform X3 n=1 Tax=Chiloscyllium plagiosum TaxID=36176 RepID=UPI001CB8805E|nr:sperm-egg fusion protein TMEM95-like isoform X3 [Chiloscyllium plagiosum]
MASRGGFGGRSPEGGSTFSASEAPSGAAGVSLPVEQVTHHKTDEVLVDMISEKVHRVLRVIEINQTLTDLPIFWNWLYEVKLPKLTQEGDSTTVINCTTCLEVEVNCWSLKTCWPNRLDLKESIYLIVGLSTGSILIGCITLIFESRKFRAEADHQFE